MLSITHKKQTKSLSVAVYVAVLADLLLSALTQHRATRQCTVTNVGILLCASLEVMPCTLCTHQLVLLCTCHLPLFGYAEKPTQGVDQVVFVYWFAGLTTVHLMIGVFDGGYSACLKRLS